MARMGGTESAEIEAPIEAVWAVVEDVLAAPEWQGGLVSVEPLERDDEGRPTLVESTSDIKVRHVTTQVRFGYEPLARLSWTQEKGELKSLQGSWELEDLGGGRTRATYSIDADPGRILGTLLRGPLEGAVTGMLVNARPGELKERVERG